MFLKHRITAVMTAFFVGVFLLSAPLYVSAAQAAGGSDKAKQGFEYVELQPLVLPIIDGNGIAQSVSLVVAIEVESTSDAEKITRIAPKLQDAYIQDMYGVLNKQSNFNEGGAIKVKNLKERLNIVSRDIAGELIHDVLLQVVQQRPL